jgi:hypothetical protein
MTNSMMLEEFQYAFPLDLNDLSLAGHEVLKIDTGLSLHRNTPLRRIPEAFHKFGSMNQDFGGDASPIEACPSYVVFFDNGHFGTQLCGTGGGHIATGPSPDDGHF